MGDIDAKKKLRSVNRFIPLFLSCWCSFLFFLFLAAAQASAATVTATANPGGSISPSGSVIVNQGTDQTFTIAPNTGYQITDVLVDGVSAGPVSTYSFTNVTADHTISASFADTTPPTGTVTINNSARFTNSAAVVLTLTATDTGSGVSSMQFSNDTTMWSASEPFAGTKNWTLTTGDGAKTVSVKFMDNAGNWSNPIPSNTISLDTTPPTVSISSPSTGYTNNPSPLLLYTVSDGTVVVKVDGFIVSKISDNPLDPLPDGSHIVRVESTDAAGNTGFSEVAFQVDTLAAPGNPNLVALWHLDGDGRDVSGNSNDLTLVNGVIFSTDAPPTEPPIPTVASQVNYYTINDGTNFTRSLTPTSATIGSGTVSQTINTDGSVKLTISNSPGYSDDGFYLNAGTLGDFNGLNIVASSGSDPVSVNIWFDADNNGEFFVWNGNVLSGLGNDSYILGPSTVQNILTVDANSNFTSLIPGGGNYTLAQLKNGVAPGITGATKIAIWVGIDTNGGSLNATIRSLLINQTGAASAQFNGSNTYLRRATGNNLPTGSASRTFMAWVKPYSYPDQTFNGIVAYGQLSCPGNGSLLSIKNDGRLSMSTWCDDAFQTTGPAATLNAWNQVAFTYDGGTTVKFYMNGQFVQESPLSAGTPVNTQDGPIRIGSTDDPGRVFNGLIGEVAIYNRALSADEIRHMLDAAIGGTPPDTPTVQQVPTTTSTNVITLSGTKPAGSSVWVNGVQIVPADNSTTWTGTYTMLPGSNTLNILTQNSSGMLSDPVTVTVNVNATPPTTWGDVLNNYNMYSSQYPRDSIWVTKISGCGFEIWKRTPTAAYEMDYYETCQSIDHRYSLRDAGAAYDCSYAFSQYGRCGMFVDEGDCLDLFPYCYYGYWYLNSVVDLTQINWCPTRTGGGIGCVIDIVDWLRGWVLRQRLTYHYDCFGNVTGGDSFVPSLLYYDLSAPQNGSIDPDTGLPFIWNGDGHCTWNWKNTAACTPVPDMLLGTYAVTQANCKYNNLIANVFGSDTEYALNTPINKNCQDCIPLGTQFDGSDQGYVMVDKNNEIDDPNNQVCYYYSLMIDPSNQLTGNIPQNAYGSDLSLSINSTGTLLTQPAICDNGEATIRITDITNMALPSCASLSYPYTCTDPSFIALSDGSGDNIRVTGQALQGTTDISNQISWTCSSAPGALTDGGVCDLGDPAIVTGPIITFTPDPPVAPAGRTAPLSYLITAQITIGSTTYQDTRVIRQDSLDELRQEYTDLPGRTSGVPERTAFDRDNPAFSMLLDPNDVEQYRFPWHILTSLNTFATNANTSYNQAPPQGGSIGFASGYRTPIGNQIQVNAGRGAPNSNHQYGRAFDFNQGDSEMNYDVYNFTTGKGADTYLHGSDGCNYFMDGRLTRCGRLTPTWPAPAGVNYTRGHMAY
jgi:hypothetical protein